MANRPRSIQVTCRHGSGPRIRLEATYTEPVKAYLESKGLTCTVQHDADEKTVFPVDIIIVDAPVAIEAEALFRLVADALQSISLSVGMATN